jgi:mercuric ion transport protein
VKERSALVGSLIAGLLASACCIGPLLLGAVGLGSLGFAAALAPLRPWFLGLTGVLIVIGFFLAYRPRRAEACAPGETCAQPTSRRNQRLALWLMTALAVTLATYPSWGARSTAAREPQTGVQGASTVVTLDVQGMTCADCEGEIERELVRVPGVVGAKASFDHKRAEVRVTSSAPKSEALIAAVEKAGYRASLARTP